MAGDVLNKVVTKVTIKGKEQKFVSLDLHQQFNAHQQFTVIVNYLSPNNTFQQTPEKFINYVGEEINIVFTHKKTGETNKFHGIVTQVEMIGSEGESGQVAIHGCSPTILYENNKTLNSWMDKTLKTIVDEAAKKLYDLTVNPANKSTILYQAQYKESAFDFLNRLSYLYGEWFYYDGEKIYFGNPKKTDEEKIVYNIDLEEVRLIANLIPGKSTRFDYVTQENKRQTENTPGTAPNMDDFQTLAHKQAEAKYSTPSILSADPHIANKEELSQQMKVIKTMAASRLINVKGIGKTCKIKIGNVINVSFPDSMKLPPLGKFRIIEISHQVRKDGHYSNSFVGIPAGMEYIPVDNVTHPVAMPELGTVDNNTDSMGRVKVRFDWQGQGKTTNWIRVQTPDAGTSDNVSANRGFVFIPEVNDEVMVNYEYGNPDRPYVAGSMFHSKSGKGGNTGNKTKSIMTRSGNGILLNDETGSIIIVDQTGKDMILIDGKDAITILATKTITLTNEKSTIMMQDDEIAISAKNIVIDAAEMLNLKSKDNQVTITSTENGVFGTGENVVFEAKKLMTLATKQGDISSQNLTIDGSADVTISGGLVKINS